MNTLSVLSGADVSGSCYLAEINGMRILFDCGVKPNCSYCEHVEIPYPETIDIIFISHAHMDHMGALAYAASVCRNAVIYATPMTADFIRYQLSSTIARHIGANTPELLYHNILMCNLVMNRVNAVNFDSKNEYVNSAGVKCNFSFFRAGHMPGAAMIYIKVDKYRFMYTGDFSSRETPLTGRYELPPNIPVDTLLLCGLHANDPDYELRAYSVCDSYERRIRQAFSMCPKIVIPSAQLTKGIEMIEIIDSMIEKGSVAGCSVWLGDSLWLLAMSFEQKSEGFRMPSYIKRLSDRPENTDGFDNEIVISDSPDIRKLFYRFEEVRPDFSLHADYAGLVELVNTLEPNEIIVVHVNNKAEKPYLSSDERIKNNISFYYPENGDICKLNGRR